jgi:hypothetical protein
MPTAETRGSRDGTEVRPFPSPLAQDAAGGIESTGYVSEQTAPQGQLPTYESVAGGPFGSPIKASGMDSKVRSID